MTDICRAGREWAGHLARLHASCFADAWSEQAFDALLASPGTFALTAQSRDQAIGFVLARVVADEAEILTLGVVPDARRRGTATRLVAAAGELCAAAGGKRLFLEVADENNAARMMYRYMGFREVGIRPGYYRDGVEDALTLRADLPLCGLGIGAELE